MTRTKYAIFPQKVIIQKINSRRINPDRGLESLPCYQLAQQVTYNASHARESLILLIVLNLPQLPPLTISNHLEISLDEEERRDTYFWKSKPRGDTLTVAREATG